MFNMIYGPLGGTMDERPDELYCSASQYCPFDATVTVDGKRFCRLHTPGAEHIVLYDTWDGQGERVTARARVEYIYSEKVDHVDLVLLDVRPGQRVRNVRYDATGRAGWRWPESEV